MSGMSDAAKAAWEYVLSHRAGFYETVEPARFRELVDLGLLEEVRRSDGLRLGRHSFRLTEKGVLQRDYEDLTARYEDPRNFMAGHVVDAIGHILKRLGPPV